LAYLTGPVPSIVRIAATATASTAATAVLAAALAAGWSATTDGHRMLATTVPAAHSGVSGAPPNPGAPSVLQSVADARIAVRAFNRRWEAARQVLPDSGGPLANAARRGQWSTWLTGADTPLTRDARLEYDADLHPDSMTALRDARRALLQALEQLAQASQAARRDPWLAGQLVGLWLDAGDADAALRAASSCGAERWWCALLRAHVHHQQTDHTMADSLQVAALSLLPDSVRCRWTDLGALIPPEHRPRYHAHPCGPVRDSVNARLWLLSQPLYTQPWNGRRVEHYSRAVLVELRGAGDDEERRELLLRYGWPSMRTSAHDWYSPGRVQLVPGWSAIEDPWAHDAVGATWLPGHAGPDHEPAAAWTHEHAVHDPGPLATIHPQVAAFRRGSDMLIVAAASLPPEVLWPRPRDSITVWVSVVSESAAGRPVALQQPPSSVHIIRAVLPDTPVILGVEWPPAVQGNRTTLRARMAVRAPPAPASGALSLSAPVLIRATSGAPPTTLEELLPLMLPGTTGRAGSVLLYWEGYAPRLDAAQRFDITVTPDPAAPGDRTEPQKAALALRDLAPRPIDAGASGVNAWIAALDLTTLPPGQWRIDIMARGHSSPVASRRLTIVP
jgi:hypothetical protein